VKPWPCVVSDKHNSALGGVGFYNIDAEAARIAEC
jgi:hypothetical protein